MSFLPLFRHLWQALLAAWNYDADAAAEERYLADAVDIHDLERRLADRARQYYPSLVGR